MTMPDTYKGGFAIGDSPDIDKFRKIYRLWQVNFHSPSEHQRNGQQLPLELQLIHKDKDSNQVAGISILFSQGPETNTFLDVVQQYGLPQKPWDEFYINKAASPSRRQATPHAK